jgi:PAS domain S-box-containing protein
MRIHAIRSLSEYIIFIQDDPHEAGLLGKDLFMQITPLFQDPNAWEMVQNEFILRLKKIPLSDLPIRAWVAGSGNGEDAYSLAMILLEAFERVYREQDAMPQVLQIFASDSDESRIEMSRKGFFPPGISADMLPDLLSRFFIRKADGFQIKNEIREKIIFTTHDLISDPPFIGLDLICFRNLLSRFSDECQNRIFQTFYKSLKSNGFLFLGNRDLIQGRSDLFIRSGDGSCLYQKKKKPGVPSHNALSREDILNPPVFLKNTGICEINDRIEKTISDILMNRFTSPAILINNEGDVLYICGNAGRYLEMSPGSADLNIYSMARHELGHIIRNALEKVMREGGVETIHRVMISDDNQKHAISLTVQVVDDNPQISDLYLVIFTPLAEKGRRRRKEQKNEGMEILLAENQQLREENSRLREEMQLSQEELSSINEEIQSRNEELQSYNEELSTSKEELQSLNEELHTLNAELQVQLAESFRKSNDLKNLMDSTEIASIFLDSELKVRYYTPYALSMFRLLVSDIGRPLSDITSSLIYPEFREDLSAVSNTLSRSEKIIRSDNGSWISCRILPYRTYEDTVDGVVITLVDITITKKAEEQSRSNQIKYQTLMENLPVGVIVIDIEARIIECNNEAATLRGCSREEHLKRKDTGDEWNFIRPDGTRLPLDEYPAVLVLRENRLISDEEIGIVRDDTSICWMSVKAVPIAIPGVGAVILYHDITRRKAAEWEQKQVEEALYHLNQQLNLMNSITRHDIMNKICVLQIILNEIRENNDPFFKSKIYKNLEITTLDIKKHLDFTRIFQDLGSHKPRWQNINAILTGLSVPETISMRVDIDDLEIFSDPLLERVFDNLLDNSVRHGVHVSRIQVYNLRSPPDFSLIWEDNGCGIPADDKEEIFKKEFGKNTGYGLFFIREVLAITGMTIRESGEEGKGARFEISIPETSYRNPVRDNDLTI